MISVIKIIQGVKAQQKALSRNLIENQYKGRHYCPFVLTLKFVGIKA